MQLGVLPILGLIFVVLKLTDNLDWSWWLVLLPFYGGAVLAILLTLIAVALAESAGASSSKTY